METQNPPTAITYTSEGVWVWDRQRQCWEHFYRGDLYWKAQADLIVETHGENCKIAKRILLSPKHAVRYLRRTASVE